MINICEQYALEHDVIFNGKKSKLLLYDSKNPKLDIRVNNQTVPIVKSAVHLGHLISSDDKYSLINDGIKNFNVSFNRFLSDFSSLHSIVKNKLFQQYCSTMYGSQLWPLWNNNMERICIQWRNALRRIWRLPRNSHTDIVHLVSDKEPLHISLAMRFIKFYRSLLTSICLVTNKLLYEHKSILSKNVKYVCNNFNLTVEEIISQPLSSIRHKCNTLWFNNIDNSTICLVHELFMNYT